MFRFEPQATGPLLGVFRNECISLEVYRDSPLLAIEPNSRVSFSLSAPYTFADTLQAMYENCYAVAEIGKILKLWPRARGGGCGCSSRQKVAQPLLLSKQDPDNESQRKQETYKKRTESTNPKPIFQEIVIPEQIATNPHSSPQHAPDHESLLQSEANEKRPSSKQKDKHTYAESTDPKSTQPLEEVAVNILQEIVIPEQNATNPHSSPQHAPDHESLLQSEANEERPSSKQKDKHTFAESTDPISAQPLEETVVKPIFQEVAEQSQLRNPTPPPDPAAVLRKKLYNHLQLPNSGFSFDVNCEVYGENHRLLEAVSSLAKEGIRKTLLVMGDSGSGKTSFCTYFAASLLETQSNLIPVYIDLCRCENLKNSISDTFRYYEIEAIEEIEHLPLLFIFDSFDRLKPYTNILEATQVLEDFPNSSVLVSCSRHIATEPLYKSWFVRRGESPLSALIELVLLPLSMEEIKKSAEERDSEFYEMKGWKDAEEYTTTVETLGVRIPLLLEKCYLHKDLMEKNSKNEQLSVHSFLLAVVNAELPNTQKSPKDNSSELTNLAFGLPLSYLNNEAIITQWIVSRLNDSQRLMFSVSLLQRVFQAYGFFTDFEERNSGHYFSDFSLTADPSVLPIFMGFLSPSNEDPRLQNFIVQMLNSNPTAAANCIAICAACGVPLPPCTLPAAVLQNVSLQGAVFRSIDFSSADFSTADISQALFIDCNITEPHLKKSQRTQLSVTVNEASALAVAPDGTLLAYAQGSDIHLATTADFAELRTLPGHESQITSMCFSDDGMYLVSVGFDGTLRWWLLPGGEIQHVEKLPKKNHGALAISPAAVVAMAGASITLWTIDGPYSVPQLAADSPSLTVAFSKAAENRLASGHKDKQIRIWAISESQVIASIDCMEAIRGLCFPDLDVIAATTAHIYCCKVDGAREEWGVTGGEVTYCGFDAHGTYLGCGFADRPGGCVFDLQNRGSVLRFPQEPLLIAVSGQCLYMGDSEEVTKIEFNSAIPRAKAKEQRIARIAISEDNRLIATALSSREVQVRERSSGKLLGSVKQQVRDVWIGNDQLRLLTADSAFLCYSLDNLSALVDLKPGIALYTTNGTSTAFCTKTNVIEVVAEQTYTLLPAANAVDYFIAIRLRADRLLGVKSKGAVVSWKYTTEEQESKPFLYGRKNPPCEFTSDSALLAVVNRQDQVEIADLDQEQSIGHFEWPAKGQLELAFVRRDYLIARKDDTVIVCKVEGLQVLSELSMSAMRNIAISADGEYLAAGELALEVFKLHVADEKKDHWSQHMTAVLRQNFARKTLVIGSYRE